MLKEYDSFPRYTVGTVGCLFRNMVSEEGMHASWKTGAEKQSSRA